MAFIITMECDKCGDNIGFECNSNERFITKKRLIEYARRSDWSIGKKVLCPSCKYRNRIKKG